MTSICRHDVKGECGFCQLEQKTGVRVSCLKNIPDLEARSATTVPCTEVHEPMSLLEAIGLDIGSLVTRKQTAYGDSFGKSGKVLAILYPTGIPLDKLDDALTITRVLDKLFRIATDKDALGESPWRDVAGYAILAVARDDRRREKKP